MTLFWQAVLAESTVAHISSSASQEVQLVPHLLLPWLLCSWLLQGNTTLPSLQKASPDPLGCATVLCKMSVVFLLQ